MAFTTIANVGTLRVAVSDAPSFGAYTVCLTETAGFERGTCTSLRARGQSARAVLNRVVKYLSSDDAANRWPFCD